MKKILLPLTAILLASLAPAPAITANNLMAPVNGLNLTNEPASQTPSQKLPTRGQYVLMTREQLKDWLFKQNVTRKIGKIQLHHTYLPSYRQFKGSNHFSMVQNMEHFHRKNMGWSNISQQFTTFPDGKVMACRPLNTPPEGSFGVKNKAVMHKVEADSIAIENIGNFDRGGNQMTAEQRETIVTLLALLSLKFGLTPSVDTITYHHWWDINTGERILDHSSGHITKTCPGTGFFGGNTTASAKTNLYPLVVQKMKELTR